MIKNFYVENYGSIKNRITISFEASALTDDTYFENLFLFKDIKMLKVSSFYGMNASGKTAVAKAFAALKELVVINPRFPFLPYNPFILSLDTKNAPTTLGIEFSLNNTDSILYRYEVSYNRNTVLKERFEKYQTQKPSLIFERNTVDSVNSIIFGSNVPANPLLVELKNSIASNRTFLSLVGQFKIQDLSEAYEFFNDRFINISPEVTRFDDFFPGAFKNNDALKRFAIKLLQAADFDINDIKIEKKPQRFVDANSQMVEIERETLVFNHKGGKTEGDIEFLNESLGTKKIMILAVHLFPALSKPSVLVVDELESSLHPELTRLIIQCFLDDSINNHNSQLIFTSHETSLLDLNLFRRDQINFIYKDKNTCSTYTRSLKDFHVRKTDSVEKSYLAGRYSTSPDIKEEILWDK